MNNLLDRIVVTCGLSALLLVVSLQGVTLGRLRISPSDVFAKIVTIEAELDEREKRFESIETQLTAQTMATRWRFTSVEFAQWLAELRRLNPELNVPEYEPLDR